MGPSYRSRKTRSTGKSSSRRKALIKKRAKKSKNQESWTLLPDIPKAFDNKNVENEEVLSGCNCSTPKAERFRIPEIKTCPPAPKKRRISANCSSRRTSITFFSHPEIELLFNFALCGIPV
ncbi:cyclin-dependent protein kinase inhibitor SMR3 [Striga asiatica]|uniref:Cyclin-dependent protein kinase inhibitor SMR3 n=1 Tax=Striga asiatica TaxID=4170 RepID=A0A5A7QMA6_STRAF|nr:cyclin-dependent protein kinase inhibitor SMR3 [Striga asiatica]